MTTLQIVQIALPCLAAIVAALCAHGSRKDAIRAEAAAERSRVARERSRQARNEIAALNSKEHE